MVAFHLQEELQHIQDLSTYNIENETDPDGLPNALERQSEFEPSLHLRLNVVVQM